jgi:hypothetical protein
VTQEKAAVALRVAAADFAADHPVLDAHDRAGQRRNRRLLAAAVRYAMTKKRGYSDEFPTTREKRVYFMLDKIPPALWIRVKAKAKREGVSLRSLILGWCQEWLDGRKQ